MNGQETMIEDVPERPRGARMLASLQHLQPAAAMVLGVAGTLVALALVVHELWHRELTPLLLLATSGGAFWVAFAASLLVEPLSDYAILRRLLGTGAETLPPLIRKQSLNAVLFGYAGDTYFLAWLQKRIGNARAAFGMVCDMTIVSALVNNIAAVVMLDLMWRPIRSLAGAQINGWTMTAAAALVAVPLVLIGVRYKKLPGAGLPTILAFLGLRTIAANVLLALTWHCALPSVPLMSWLLLLTGRMVVSRLPIVPNKDIAFAGFVAIFLGPNEQIVPVIAGVALLTLAAHAILIVMAPLFVLPHRRAALC